MSVDISDRKRIVSTYCYRGFPLTTRVTIAKETIFTMRYTHVHTHEVLSVCVGIPRTVLLRHIHVPCEPKTDQFRFSSLSLEMPTPMVYVLGVLEVDWRMYYVYYPCIQMYVGGRLAYADSVFNGYGTTKKDFLKQVRMSHKPKPILRYRSAFSSFFDLTAV